MRKYCKEKAEQIIWNTKMKGNNKILLLAINFLADENGECCPVIEKLVSITGLGESSVHLYLNRLVADKFIEKGKREDEFGFQLSNLYRIMI